MALRKGNQDRRELEEAAHADGRIEAIRKSREAETGSESTPERTRSDTGAISLSSRKTGFLVRLSPADHAALQRDSEARGISMAAIVRELVHKYLKRI